MKHMRWICALALIAALLLALPALAEGTEGTLPGDPTNETSEAHCPDSATGEHQIADDAWVISVEPSCMVGLRKGLCTACGRVYNEVIPATGDHVWDEGEVTTAPTCVDAGVKTFKCTVCGETKTEDIPALDHDFSVEVTAEVPATCTTDGTTAVMKCSRCNETEGGETIPATGHTVTTWELVEKATCSAEGKEKGVCDVCGQTVEQAIPIDPVAHAFDNGVETPATCTVDGKVVYTCKLCNATQEVAIPAPGHAWDAGVETTAPTCETEGVKTFTCTVCDDTKTEVLPATGHKPDAGKVTKEPTCTVDGVKTYTCLVCGKHLDEAIPAEGHDWGEWVTLRQATEEQNGEQERTCQVCGATQTREVQYKGDMPKTGVFTVPTAWLVAALALSLTGYIALKRRSECR